MSTPHWPHHTHMERGGQKGLGSRHATTQAAAASSWLCPSCDLLPQCSQCERKKSLKTKVYGPNWQPHQPKRLKNHLAYFRCSMEKFTFTLITLRLCIHYNSALVIQVVKYFSIPLDFAYDGFASVTAGRLSKLCFCGFFKTCIQLDMVQNRLILPFIIIVS